MRNKIAGGHQSRREASEIIWSRFFMGWMPFVSLSRQC